MVINEIFHVKFVQSDENVIKEKKENVQKRGNVSILYEYTWELNFSVLFGDKNISSHVTLFLCPDLN